MRGVVESETDREREREVLTGGGGGGVSNRTGVHHVVVFFCWLSVLFMNALESFVVGVNLGFLSMRHTFIRGLFNVDPTG